MHRMLRIAAMVASLVPAGQAMAGGDFAFSLPREDGGGWVEPGGFGGGPAVFLFWSGDCAYCLVELAALPALQSALPGARFVAVTVDSREAARRAMARLSLPPAVVRARAPLPRGLLARLGDKSGALPFAALFDGKGRFCASSRGPLDPVRLKRLAARCPPAEGR